MSLPGNAPSSTFGGHSLAWPNNSGRRSPLIAALFSLLVPGLGQVYVGRPVRGAAWFCAILAVEAATLYFMFNQPRFWMIALSIAAWLAATLFQIGEAAVLARRATHYQLQRYNKWYVYVALLAVGTALNLATCVALTRDAATRAGAYSIDSSSMQPAIQRGDRFVADRNHYRRNEPALGDVAVYLHPRRPETLYVKRIIALAGDRVAIRDGRAIVNGFALDEPYAILGGPAALYNQTREITVPDGHVFVLGDNRANSLDSRAVNDHGPVPVENLRARATDIAWSRTLSRIGRWIGTP
jgi:signal peptidase I